MFDRDVEELPDTVLQEMTDRDDSRANGLIRDFADIEGLEPEVQNMKDGGYKAELEALHFHGLGYLTDKYIPERIADPASWVVLER